MNKKFVTIVMATLAFICQLGTINAQTSGNVIIGLLKDTPAKTIKDCSAEDLMNLLSNDGSEWIESIECKNVDIVAGQAGAQLVATAESTEPSYIKFNFKNNPVLKATNVSFYGYDRNNNNFEPQIFVNEILTTPAADAFFKKPTNSNLDSATADKIDDGIQGKTGGITSPRIYVTSLENNDLINSCEIRVDAKQKENLELFALRIFYSDQITNPSTSVVEIINDIDCDVRYFDLQGRELNQIPAKGIYLRSCNGKTTKHIAK